jgi:3-oxoacyl-[acyl-carrier protein] reductase
MAAGAFGDERQPDGDNRKRDMMGRLDNRVAIVTGASWGIGAAVAEAFAREGAAVVVNNLPEERMDSLAEGVVARITAAGGRAIKVPADISVPNEVDNMVALAERTFGDIDILVANAAYSERVAWTEISLDQWDRTMAVNVRGTYLCARAVYPSMLRLGRGSIITLTSVTVELGMAGFLDYVSSKAGIIGLTRALAREVGSDGIRVNSVMPGAIRTEQEVELNFDERELAAVSADRQSIPRRGYADDLTGTFIYLASDDSAFVTGQVVTVDGGWVHH